MPFTLAHPAAVLPLRRALPWLPLDALVIGAMAPDLWYVIHLTPRGRFGHTPEGVLLFCLPISLLLVACWRGLVAPAVELPGVRPVTGRVALAAACASLIGALSHLVWDGFTHSPGWFVQLVPWMREHWFGIARYRYAQHASTVVGGAVLVAAVLSGWGVMSPAARRNALAALGVAVALGALGAGLNGARAAGFGFRIAVGYAAVGFLAGGAAGLLAWACARRLREH